MGREPDSRDGEREVRGGARETVDMRFARGGGLAGSDQGEGAGARRTIGFGWSDQLLAGETGRRRLQMLATQARVPGSAMKPRPLSPPSPDCPSILSRPPIAIPRRHRRPACTSPARRAGSRPCCAAANSNIHAVSIHVHTLLCRLLVPIRARCLAIHTQTPRHRH